MLVPGLRDSWILWRIGSSGDGEMLEYDRGGDSEEVTYMNDIYYRKEKKNEIVNKSTRCEENSQMHALSKRGENKTKQNKTETLYC